MVRVRVVISIRVLHLGYSKVRVTVRVSYWLRFRVNGWGIIYNRKLRNSA